MRSFLLALLCITLPTLTQAQSGDYEIAAIDAAKGTLTCKRHDQLQAFRTRAGVEITLNGAAARFDELESGMKVKVVSGDPGVATALVAYGVRSRPTASPGGSPAAPTDSSPASNITPATEGIRKLRGSLAGTKWRWPDAKMAHDKAWFRLNADGSATAGWHEGARTWRVLSDSTIELRITVNSGTQIIHFDSNLTQGTDTNKKVYPRLKE